MNSAPSFVTPETAPRNKEGLMALTRSARIRLAMQINMLPSEDVEKAFVSGTDDDQSNALLAGLQIVDQQRGQPLQHLQPPMQSNPQQQVPMQTQPGQPMMQPMTQQPQQGFGGPQMPPVIPPPAAGMQPQMLPQAPPQQGFGGPSPQLPPFPGNGQAPGAFGQPGPMMGQPMMGQPQPQGFGQPMMGGMGGPPQAPPAGIPQAPPPGFGGGGQMPQGFAPPGAMTPQGFAPPMMNPGQGFAPQMQPQGFAPAPQAPQMGFQQPPQAQPQPVPQQAQAPQGNGPALNVPQQAIEELLKALKLATETSQGLLQQIYQQQTDLAAQQQQTARQIEFLLRVNLWVTSGMPGYTPEGLMQAAQSVDTGIVERVLQQIRQSQPQQAAPQGKA